MPQASTVEWGDPSVTEVRRFAGEDLLARTYSMISAERGGDRRLPMWIGPAEATALILALESAEAPRPFTYEPAVYAAVIVRLGERYGSGPAGGAGPGGTTESA